MGRILMRLKSRATARASAQVEMAAAPVSWRVEMEEREGGKTQNVRSVSLRLLVQQVSMPFSAQRHTEMAVQAEPCARRERSVRTARAVSTGRMEREADLHRLSREF
jgi:hypothetical protein